MEKRKANGLQDNDIGFPNTPVRRYMYRKKLEKEMLNADATKQNGEQLTQPQQNQQQHQMPMQQQQQQQMQMQPQMQMNMQPQMQMNMQPHMRMQTPQMQPMMMSPHQNFQQHQNMPSQHNPQQQQNVPQQEFNVTFQDSDKCTKRYSNVENGMDAIINQQKKNIRPFDPTASIMKQREHENQWQFGKREPNQQTQQYNACQQGTEPDVNQQYQPPMQQSPQSQGHQMMFQNPHYSSQFSNQPVYHHSQHLNQKPNITPSPPPKNGMQPTMSPQLSAAYSQNYHGHNHQYQPTSENPDVGPANGKHGDCENNPYLIGQNQRHNYQPMYAENNQQRNQYQQPSYYMNQPQPTGAQHYQQSFHGQAQMQA